MIVINATPTSSSGRCLEVRVTEWLITTLLDRYLPRYVDMYEYCDRVAVQ